MPSESFTLPLATPPWTKTGKHLESLTRKAIHAFEMLPDQESCKIAIALSGGKDSLALLFLLHAISGRGFPKLNLCAIHVDGPFSCGAGVSLSYLEAICTKLEVPFITRTSNQTLEGLECYSCSRERRGLLFEAAKEFGAKHIAFGHHRDDNVQTLLLNMFHKGSPAGMLPKVPMLNYGITILRPLILCSEQQIIAFAEQHGFRRITCQCPVGQNSKRKSVEKILTHIEKEFPNVRGNLSQVSLEWSDKGALTP